MVENINTKKWKFLDVCKKFTFTNHNVNKKIGGIIIKIKEIKEKKKIKFFQFSKNNSPTELLNEKIKKNLTKLKDSKKMIEIQKWFIF